MTCFKHCLQSSESNSNKCVYIFVYIEYFTFVLIDEVLKLGYILCVISMKESTKMKKTHSPFTMSSMTFIRQNDTKMIGLPKHTHWLIYWVFDAIDRKRCKRLSQIIIYHYNMNKTKNENKLTKVLLLGGEETHLYQNNVQHFCMNLMISMMANRVAMIKFNWNYLVCRLISRSRYCR